MLELDSGLIDITYPKIGNYLIQSFNYPVSARASYEIAKRLNNNVGIEEFSLYTWSEEKYSLANLELFIPVEILAFLFTMPDKVLEYEIARFSNKAIEKIDFLKLLTSKTF